MFLYKEFNHDFGAKGMNRCF